MRSASVSTQPRAELRETHSAIVVLVGDRVYKVKKPVDLGFLDFRTEESRRDVCRREVELNRRLAPDVYLDVFTVAGSTDAVLEHGVLMRRMPEERRLSALLGEDVAIGPELLRLAELLARFHRGADRRAEISAEGRVEGLRRRWKDNLRETERFRGSYLSPTMHEQITDLALRYLDGREVLLSERAAAGLVVDGHGDLTAEDVFLLPDGPRVLDCLEFDDRLRWVDVLDDVAFLAMDLERLGRADLARSFLHQYLTVSGATGNPSLEHHYIAYRAFVRAKVSWIQAEQGRTTAASDGDLLARLTLRHLAAGEVTLVLVGGAPGTGKSTLARALAARLGADLLSTDTIRPDVPVARGPDRYSEYARSAVYTELLSRAAAALQRGRPVVADATWGSVAARTAAATVAVSTSSRMVALECRAPVSIAADRAQRRLEGAGDSSEAGAAVARSLAAGRPPWPEAVAVDTTGTAEASLAHALAVVSAPRTPDG